MKHKITWKISADNGPFKRSKNKVTIVMWKDHNFALFLNKTKAEVEESFAVRLSVMEPIEFEINKGEFIGYESCFNEKSEVYMENPNAEMQLMMQQLFASVNG